nr:immunoglobulin heavy chain junction region [Mus musculus]
CARHDDYDGYFDVW